MLEELGHRARGGASGTEAPARLQAGARFDLVVIDHAMPGMTGMQLAEALRRQQPRLPIILATGFAELPEDGPALVRLMKPFGQEQLAEAIEEGLGTIGAG